MGPAYNQVVDEPANRLPFAISPLPHLHLEFLVQHPFDSQAVRKVLQQYRARMAREVFLAKADVELAHFSDYLLLVHLLSASCAMKWSVSNHHFCCERRHFASY